MLLLLLLTVARFSVLLFFHSVNRLWRMFFMHSFFYFFVKFLVESLVDFCVLYVWWMCVHSCNLLANSKGANGKNKEANDVEGSAKTCNYRWKLIRTCSLIYCAHMVRWSVLVNSKCSFIGSWSLRSAHQFSENYSNVLYCTILTTFSLCFRWFS